jgi:crossover junction endodeoxyribonuclease RuvC
VRILGVDPSLRSTGYGVIEQRGRQLRLLEAGVITTSARERFASRLGEIAAGIGGVIAEAQPDVMVIEEVFARPVNPRTTIVMAHARGVLLGAASGARMQVCELSATTVKRAVTGRGAASKEQVGRMVAALLALATPPRPADVTDALALAIAFAHRQGSRAATDGARR